MKKDLLYYKRLNYEIRVEQEKDGLESWYIAYCEELGRGSCYGTGDTPQEALSRFMEDKNEFITYLYESGKPIPEPESKDDSENPLSGIFNVRTSPQIHGLLARQAKEQGVSLNLYVNQILATASQSQEMKQFMNRLCNRIEDKIDTHHVQMTSQFVEYEIKSIDTPKSQYKYKEKFNIHHPYKQTG